MAASITAELMALIEEKKYKQIIPALSAGSGLSEETFPRTSLAKIFSLDTARWLDGSFMNPNALFELFGTFSGQTGIQVRKSMMKYLGISKKRGADKCKSLKNAWITLHMQNHTPRQWADAMLDRETPGDKIALFILCKMYHRHCIVLTSAKCWTTMEAEMSLPESVLYEHCDVKLLYIKPGVFGELRIKLAMPPVPTNTYIVESATAIVKCQDTSPDLQNEPINLSVSDMSKVDVGKSLPAEYVPVPATGDNDCERKTETANVSMEQDFDPHQDATLSGALDRISSHTQLDSLLAQFLVQHELAPHNEQVIDNSSPDDVLEFPTFTENIQPPYSCVVKLTPVSNIDLEAWLKDNDRMDDCPASGNELRQHPNSSNPTRLHRKAKRNISYVINSESSQDEDDFTVRPGRWS